MFKIPLKNRKKEIIEYSIVDEDIYNKLIDTNWSYNKNEYAMGKIEDFFGLLHRYVISAKKGQIIDHINNNKLDNRLANLRVVTYSQNSQNKQKKEGSSSKYFGVSYYKRHNKWECKCKNIKRYFKEEMHSAYWYDQLAIKHFGEGAKINNITKPEDFIEPIDKIKDGVTITDNGKFMAQITVNGKTKNAGTYKTREEAAKIVIEYKESVDKKKEAEILEREMKRNEDGEVIIQLTNSEKQCIIDEDDYYNLIKYKWRKNPGGYIDTSLTNKICKMHRMVIGAIDGDIIDHINGNKLDNRKENLRKSTYTLNAHNRLKQKNTSSNYIGVSKQRNKFRSDICKDGIKYRLGTFDTEEKAAKAYDKKSFELYGNYSKLNYKNV